jgi:uncharacterized protein (TIGR02117 family)
MRVRCLIAIITALVVAGCSTPPPGVADRPATDTVYVVAHGWHAGVTIPIEFAEGLLQEPIQHTGPRHLEIGWGDRGYYPDSSPSLGTLLRAGIIPSPSTLHVVAVPTAVPEYFRVHDIIAIPTPDSLLNDLRAYLLAAFKTGEDGLFIPHDEPLYGAGHFYKGTERYHAFNNCNHWVARALRTIGCEVSVFRSLTLGSLMQQARACGVSYRRSGT